LAVESKAAQRFVQWVLRAGLVVACGAFVVGLVLAIATGEHAAEPVRLAKVFAADTLADRCLAIGLVVLAFTPVVRVMSLVVIWAIERDRRFVIVGLVVIAVLAAAMFGGHG
jgi:uncharacterized membrane protein